MRRPFLTRISYLNKERVSMTFIYIHDFISKNYIFLFRKIISLRSDIFLQFKGKKACNLFRNKLILYYETTHYFRVLSFLTINNVEYVMIFLFSYVPRRTK